MHLNSVVLSLLGSHFRSLRPSSIWRGPPELEAEEITFNRQAFGSIGSSKPRSPFSRMGAPTWGAGGLGDRRPDLKYRRQIFSFHESTRRNGQGISSSLSVFI